MNSLMILMCLFLVAASASSSSIEDRLQQVETQVWSTNKDLDRLRRENVFLKSEIGDIKHEDDKNKKKIQQLVEENKVIRIELAEVKRDRVEDGEEVKKLKSQVESQREELMEAKSKIDDLDESIQEMQSNCCVNGQGPQMTNTLLSTTSITTQVTTKEPLNTEIKVVDIGTSEGRLTDFKELNYIATGWSNGVKIYDLRSKQLVRSLENLRVYDIQPFRQSQLIQSTNSAIKIWNVESGELVRTLECESCGDILTIGLNKDESLILSGDRNRQVILWNMTEYKEIRRFLGHTSGVYSVLFNEANDQVISGSSDRAIIVWNMSDGSLIRTLTGHSSTVKKVLFDEHTGHLYSGSDDSTIKEWDLESGRELRTFTGHSSHIYDLMWSEDDKRLISASNDNTVRIWSKQTGQVINQLNHTHYFYGLALNPLNGQLMSTTGDSKLIFWPLKP